MLTSYSRVTVVSGTRHVDLALPSALPVGDVVPQVMRFCAPDEDPEGPSEFTLAKVGGQSLPLSQSLGEAGVRDGDVIELRSFSTESRTAFVEDVRDAIEDSVDGAGGAWTSRSTVTFSIIALSGVLLLFLITPLLGLMSDAMAGQTFSVWPDEQTAAEFVAAAVLVAATWVGTRWGAYWVPYISTSVAALSAFSGGVAVTASNDGGLAAELAVGAAAGVLVAAVSRLLTPRATPLLAASVVLCVAPLLVLIVGGLGVRSDIVIKLVALVAVLTIGVMPRLSIAVGGLSSADYRVRNAGRMTDRALAARLHESSSLLLGSIIGVSLLVGFIGYWLGTNPDAWGDDLWDGLLSVSLAAALLLRSRVFSRIQYMLAPRILAIFVLLATVWHLAGESHLLSMWLPAAVAGVGAVAIGVSILQLSDVTRARIKRTLNVVEFFVVVDLIVVTMGAVTLYHWMGS
ncbi:MAG: type VII secretion integral membrane protein EccD [Nocardioidaceae bacterium]